MANRKGKGRAVTDFLFLDSKITVDGDCSHEVKRCLLHGRKAMTNLDTHFKKQRHHFADKGPYSQLPTKVGIVKALVFPVVMYGCESLAIKKAEH